MRIRSITLTNGSLLNADVLVSSTLEPAVDGNTGGTLPDLQLRLKMPFELGTINISATAGHHQAAR